METVNQDEKKEATTPNKTFAGFILLDKAELDIELLQRLIREDWNLTFADASTNQDNQILVADANGMTIAISLMPAPIPDQEAVNNAKTNFRWPGAVEVAEKHQAHILVAIMNKDKPINEAAKLFVKICSSCLKLPHATAINTLGTVFEPNFYMNAAKTALEQDELPILNLVFFGIYSEDGKTVCGYTFGMELFNKRNMEVLNSQHDPNEVMEFLYDIVGYVLEQDVLLQDGETIGFSEEERLPITLIDSSILEQKTLQIGF